MTYIWDSVPAHMADAEEEFTTQYAADVLHMSRADLIGLLDRGEIEYRKVGTRRRVLAGSVLAYQQKSSLVG